MTAQAELPLSDSARRHAERRVGFVTHFGFYLVANLVMMAWDVLIGDGFFLRIYPLIGWGIGVAFHGVLVWWMAPANRMCQPTPPISRFPRLRRLGIDFVFNTAFCVVCAVIVTYMMRVGDSFYVNLVFSLCIGTLAWLAIDGGRLLIWGENRPYLPLFLILIGVSIPSAKYFGSMLACRLLDLPAQQEVGYAPQNQAGFLILTILAALFITWFFWNRATLEHLQAEAEAEKARAAAIEKQALQAQLQLLQAQIEPHMLFNTLANLQGLIAVDAPRAQHMLDQLILYLRATLSASRASDVPLEQEFSLMRAYLELMSIRMGERLAYTLDLPDTLCALPVPPMLLQPLVENAIKHGLEPKLDGGRIDVTARLDGGLLTLTVADTGLGMEHAAPATAQSGAGIGTANVRERLQVLYGARASLSLRPNTPVGTVAELSLPLST